MPYKLVKWSYAFAMLGATLFWAYVSLNRLEQALATGLPTDVLVSSVVSVLLGALITWEGQVVTFYFRKSGPDDVPPTPPATPITPTP